MLYPLNVSLNALSLVFILEAGNDMKFIQERLGHGSVKIASDVYSHISIKIEVRSMEKYEAHIKSILE